MPETVPTPSTENAQAEPWEKGSDEEALAALTAQTAQAVEQPTTEEAKPDDEPAKDPEQEAEPADPADGDDAEQLVEVTLEGKTFNVAPEVEKAMLRQADYSRKMNEVSAKEKAATQRIEVADKLTQGAEKYAAVLAESNAIDSRLKQFEAVNWQALRQENPGEYAAAAADLQSLRMAKENANQRARGLDAEITEDRNKILGERRDEMFKVLQREIKGWTDANGVAITEYAMKNNVQFETLQNLTDPGVVLALEKARKYDALQASKTALKAQAQNAAPVMRPGAPRKINGVADAMAQLRKSNSEDDGVAALLALRNR